MSEHGEAHGTQPAHATTGTYLRIALILVMVRLRTGT